MYRNHIDACTAQSKKFNCIAMKADHVIAIVPYIHTHTYTHINIHVCTCALVCVCAKGIVSVSVADGGPQLMAIPLPYCDNFY